MIALDLVIEALETELLNEVVDPWLPVKAALDPCYELYGKVVYPFCKAQDFLYIMSLPMKPHVE